MSTINDGGPAFPSEEPSFIARDDVIGYSPGMTLRDYFAAKVLQGLVAGELRPGVQHLELACVAYSLAEAMLVVRNEKEQPK